MAETPAYELFEPTLFVPRGTDKFNADLKPIDPPDGSQWHV
jgi:hypothetical protein